jgi:putative FmdB family regulatory protein
MPTYEYRCTSCGAEFEKFQRMSDEPVADCPACGTAAQRKISGGAGLVFKGSGFYITDYARGDSYKKAAAADGGAPAAPSGGGDAKPAPAPKADAKPSSGSGSSGGSSAAPKGD